LPDERALTWLGLSLAKLGLGTLAGAVEPAADPAPVNAVTPIASVTAPSSEAAFLGVKDILVPPFRPALWVPWMCNRGRPFGSNTVPPLDQGRMRNRRLVSLVGLAGEGTYVGLDYARDVRVVLAERGQSAGMAGAAALLFATDRYWAVG
jgi:hypothetical protein